MMGRTHLTTGVAAGAWTAAAVSTFAPDAVAVLVVPVVAYAALLPDLDHPRSAATYSVGPVTMIASWVLRLWFAHRGPTHDIRHAPVAFAVPAGLASLALPPSLAAWWFVWALAVAVGIAVHIWGDARTIAGVPWCGGRGRIGRPFRTGGAREKRLAAMIYRPCAVASLALAVIAIGAT